MNNKDQQSEGAMETVLRYHDRTKHHFRKYAASLGFMDWANQPNPFRRFEGAPFVSLSRFPQQDGPAYDALFRETKPQPTVPLTMESVSRLFHDSLALSAWKSVAGSSWSLRVNPSSGNLHPTEGYWLGGALDGLSHEPGLWHYAPHDHGLELRRSLPQKLWDRFCAGSGYDGFVALTSIHWRESWKYGERAFRYCQHDAGHAVAALSMACAALGWRCELIETFSDRDLAMMLGLGEQSDGEQEHPDCLLGIVTDPGGGTDHSSWPGKIADEFDDQPLQGKANQLSPKQQPWPIIDEVAQACVKPAVTLDRPASKLGDGPPPGKTPFLDDAPSSDDTASPEDTPPPNEPPPTSQASKPMTENREVSARQIIHQRRSAMDMDGETEITRETFYRIIERLVPKQGHPVWRAWPWPSSANLALFVHRVIGLPRGLYWLHRTSDHESVEEAQKAMRSGFEWKRPEACPDHIPLYLLHAEDLGETASLISCQQAIAEDGVFAAAMVANFKPMLTAQGPWFYRRLFWETGMIGQLLYLEAEAAGIRGTGIGCFFDDAMHELLGIDSHDRQSLYHFTVGGPREDTRLQTLAPYHHLEDKQP